MGSIRSHRSDIMAGLALAFALLALYWSSRPVVRDATAPHRDVSIAPPAPVNKTLLPLPVAAGELVNEDLANGNLDALSQTSARIVARASRSVVRVEHASHRRVAPQDDLELYFGRLPLETFGSGTVIDASGLVLTNYHVVRGAVSLSVRDADQTERVASLVGYDALTDLALLHVPDLNLPALPWGDSRQTVSGQLVWAIGNPYGLDQSVSLGIVSATNRPTLLDSPYQDFLQTDAAISPGSSGGPLLNAHSEIIGINTAMAADSFAGIGFALPSHIARDVCQQLRSTGDVPRGWIGVQLGEVTAARGAVAGLSAGAGAYVESLASGSAVPAVDAGLRTADICTEFQGRPIAGPLGLLRKIAGHPIGTTAKLNVRRAGQAIELQVLVQARP